MCMYFEIQFLKLIHICFVIKLMVTIFNEIVFFYNNKIYIGKLCMSYLYLKFYIITNTFIIFIHYYLFNNIL